MSVQTIAPSPSHSPETLITTINVVDKLNVPKWHLQEVLAHWNKVKLVKFKLTNRCVYGQPCVTVAIKNLKPEKPDQITVGNSIWNDYPWEMEVNLNPYQLNRDYAQSTICHEFGHIIGLGHVITKHTKTCMKAEDDNAPINPTDLDIKIANRLGPWTFEKSRDSSGRDIDLEDTH